jgi:endonuclease G
MKKFILSFIAALFAATLAFASDQSPPKDIKTCAVQIPYGEPSTVANHPVICRSGYILEHDPVAKIPNWVAWTLTPEHSIGCAPREDAFAADASLPANARAVPQDYAGSGYDQGHLANNADMSWDPAVAKESFYMSNMSPQLPNVNRGTWKNLESAERAWVYQTKHAHTIYAGNIYSTSSKTIGADKVVVPDTLFKIVIDDTTKKSYAFLFPNKVGIDSDFTKFQVTVSDVEKASGTTFPVPDAKNIKNPVIVADLATLAADKKKQCKQ